MSPRAKHVLKASLNGAALGGMVAGFGVLHEENDFGARAWKGHDWDALNRLHESGLIEDPKNKAKSVVLTKEGVQKSRELVPQAVRETA